MSYSIGPYMGKRDAVIAAVKKSLETMVGQSKEEAQRAVDFIVGRLERMPEKSGCIARAYGSEYHAGGEIQSQNHCIEVGQVGSHFQTPFYVE